MSSNVVNDFTCENLSHARNVETCLASQMLMLRMKQHCRVQQTVNVTTNFMSKKLNILFEVIIKEFAEIGPVLALAVTPPIGKAYGLQS